MLGNFSFGDYFKSEVIPWAWEYVTEVLKIPVNQLWITVHPEDEDARQLWLEKAGVQPERILNDPENLWAAGPVGPCGYCSEIYVDLGIERGCGKPDCAVGCDCDRFLEIWNLVFMQYNRDENGMLTPLPKQNIDTGMGLERIAAVMQGAETNFDTDLFRPIIDKVAEIAGVQYHVEAKTDIALKVVADHTRAVSFMLSDGIRPGRDGRGYVLRRILRRAIRYARLLGIDKPFLEPVFRIIQRDYAHHYPELKENENFILNHLRLEEKNFQATLEQGTLMIQEKVKSLQEAVENILSGADAFNLYETYGFPVELTEEILAEQGLSVDMAGYEIAAEEHRRLAKEQSQQMRAVQESPAIAAKAKALGTTSFDGYDVLGENVKIEALFVNGEAVTEAAEGDEVLCFLSQTPFYAESGGQVADLGILRTVRAEAQLLEVKKGVTGTYYHKLLVTQGILHTGEMVEALVDQEARKATARHHSATHLLQAALRSVLGEHVQQAGSLVTPEHLRFDFTHFHAMTENEIQRVEDQLNQAILGNLSVSTAQMGIEEAKGSGATALFGEKYGDVVRVVSMGDYSKELCGGTHARATGDIGLVKILSEGGIGAGLRRIEAVAGLASLDYTRKLDAERLELAQLLKAQPADLTKRVQGLVTQVHDLEKELQQQTAKMAKYEVEGLMQRVKEVEGVAVIAAAVQASDMDALRNMADMLRDKLKSGVIILGAPVEGKVNWVTLVNPTGLSGLHAGQIIKEVAKITGGGGGGRPDMAQAGGKDPAKLGEALDQVPRIIQSFLRK